LEGLLTIGLAIYFIERVPLSTEIMQMIANSKVAAQASRTANVFIPLLPDALNLLKSTVDFVQHKFK